MSEDNEQSLIEHLAELRTRLLRAVGGVVLVFLVLAPFSSELYSALAQPLLKHLPDGSSMVAIDVASPFLTPFKFTFVLAIVLAMPLILYQIWAFVAPGLYKHEKRIAVPILFSASALFYFGCMFAYYVVFPIIFGFFTAVAPEGVQVMTDIGRYLDFVFVMFLAFGIAFEVPVAVFILVALGVVEPDQLGKYRPYVIVGAFAAGMLLTPPDVVSQTLLAIPMWILYELGIVMSRIFLRRDETQAHAE